MAKDALDDRKEIRISIPLRQHIQLRALKLFTDVTMSEAIERALDQYLAEQFVRHDIPMPEGSPADHGEAAAGGGAGGGAETGAAGQAEVGQAEAGHTEAGEAEARDSGTAEAGAGEPEARETEAAPEARPAGRGPVEDEE